MTGDVERPDLDAGNVESRPGSTSDGRAVRTRGDVHQELDSLVDTLIELTSAIRALAARSPVSSEELLTAEQVGDLFRLSPRTLRDLAAAGLIPYHRIGKHYRFSRDDIVEILRLTKQELRNRHMRLRAA